MPVREWLDGIKDRPWLPQAACGKDYGPPTEYFHSTLRQQTQIAMNFCKSSCPVRAECLDDAMRHEAEYGHRFGVFGGYSARGRRELAAEQRRAADGGAR